MNVLLISPDPALHLLLAMALTPHAVDWSPSVSEANSRVMEADLVLATCCQPRLASLVERLPVGKLVGIVSDDPCRRVFGEAVCIEQGAWDWLEDLQQAVESARKVRV